MSQTNSTQLNLDSIGGSRTARGHVDEQPWNAEWHNVVDRRRRGVDAVPDRVLRRRKIWAVKVEYDVSHAEAARLLNKEENGIEVSDKAVMG